jgi:molybdate transport system substrate-binding protein
MRRLAGALALGACVAAAGCGDDEAQGERPRLVVSAAASLREPLERCAPAFADADVRLSFGGSDELAAQIRQGADADVYAAASTRLPDELHDAGLLEAPVAFATNELVLAVPEGSRIGGLGDLTADGTKLVVGAASVPVGAYTREALAKLPPIRERAILANVVSEEPDVKGIVGKLVQRAGDAGFVYASDAGAAGGALRAIPLPARLEPRVAYAAGVVTASERPQLARRFLDDLAGGACADALRQAGFGPAP